MLALGSLFQALQENVDIIPLRDGEAYSLPFIATIGEEQLPAVFVYSKSPFAIGTPSRFFANDLYVFPTDDPGDVRMLDIAAVDTHANPTYLDGMKRNSDTPLPDEHERLLRLLSDIDANLQLTPDTAREISTAFVNVVPRELWPTYFAIGKDFFSRLDQLRSSGQ